MIFALTKANLYHYAQRTVLDLQTALLRMWKHQQLKPKALWLRLDIKDMDEAFGSGKLNLFYKYVAADKSFGGSNFLDRLILLYGEDRVEASLKKSMNDRAPSAVAKMLISRFKSRPNERTVSAALADGFELMHMLELLFAPTDPNPKLAIRLGAILK